MTDVTLVSTLRCPACGHTDALAMPTDACLFFHECAECRTLVRPKTGDCCVFCSYGTVPCTPIQTGGRCEGASTDVADGADCCGAADSTVTSTTPVTPVTDDHA